MAARPLLLGADRVLQGRVVASPGKVAAWTPFVGGAAAGPWTGISQQGQQEAAGRVTIAWDSLVRILIIDTTFIITVTGLLPPPPTPLLPLSLSASASASPPTSSSSPPVTGITFCGRRVNDHHRHQQPQPVIAVDD